MLGLIAAITPVHRVKNLIHIVIVTSELKWDRKQGVDPYGIGPPYPIRIDALLSMSCPPIFIKVDVHGNVPQYFRSDAV